MKCTATDILRLIRPHQYIKNLFIFMPLFFVGQIGNIELFANALIAFIGFSLVASSIYTLNDYVDIEEDRQHPQKKFRPLASGAVSKSQAILIMGVSIATGFFLVFTLSHKVAAIVFIYVLMNVAYSFYLKQVAILDVVIIAIGFVLRLFIGSTATGVELSMWIVIMTFLLALFIALAKRRDDVLIYLETGDKMRKVINGYNLQFLDIAMAITASVVIVSYITYTTSPEVTARVKSKFLYLTSLFVILGIMRYLQVAFVLKDSGSPTKIVLKDRFLQATLIGWLLAFAWILY
jgi:decaprenyl-phosphate phosphoribosyltransferase